MAYEVEPCNDPLELWRVVYPDHSRRYFGSKAEAMRHARIRILVSAAEKFIENEAHVAMISYRTWNGSDWVWNDQVWEDGAPDQFALVQELRQAIKAVEGL